jgi:hypothetical protein
MESLGGATGGSMESALDQEPETPETEETPVGQIPSDLL